MKNENKNIKGSAILRSSIQHVIELSVITVEHGDYLKLSETHKL